MAQSVHNVQIHLIPPPGQLPKKYVAPAPHKLAIQVQQGRQVLLPHPQTVPSPALTLTEFLGPQVALSLDGRLGWWA